MFFFDSSPSVPVAFSLFLKLAQGPARTSTLTLVGNWSSCRLLGPVASFTCPAPCSNTVAWPWEPSPFNLLCHWCVYSMSVFLLISCKNMRPGIQVRDLLGLFLWYTQIPRAVSDTLEVLNKEVNGWIDQEGWDTKWDHGLTCPHISQPRANSHVSVEW